MKATLNDVRAFLKHDDTPESRPEVYGFATFSDGYYCRFAYQPGDTRRLGECRLFQRDAHRGTAEEPQWIINPRPSAKRQAAIVAALDAGEYAATVAAERAHKSRLDAEHDSRMAVASAYWTKRDAAPRLFEALKRAAEHLADGCPPGLAAEIDAALHVAGTKATTRFRVWVAGDVRQSRDVMAHNAAQALELAALGGYGWRKRLEDGRDVPYMPAELRAEMAL